MKILLGVGSNDLPEDKGAEPPTAPGYGLIEYCVEGFDHVLMDRVVLYPVANFL